MAVDGPQNEAKGDSNASEWLPHENERDPVFLWRCEELRRAGYGLKGAILLAANPNVDLHLAIELRARGCSHETALRILA